jgi:hypothetical protein
MCATIAWLKALFLNTFIGRECVCICVCRCVCVCVYEFVYVCMCMSVCMCVNVHVCVCMCVWAFMCICICVLICMYVLVYVCMYVCICVCTCVRAYMISACWGQRAASLLLASVARFLSVFFPEAPRLLSESIGQRVEDGAEVGLCSWCFSFPVLTERLMFREGHWPHSQTASDCSWREGATTHTMHIHKHIHIHIYTGTYTGTNTYTHIHTHIYQYIHTY